MSSYLVYLKWTIRNAWASDRGAPPEPHRYASRQPRFQPRQGDSVWVVACPRWPGGSRLPPTLVAQLVAREDVIDLDRAGSVDPADQRFRAFGRFLAKGDPGRGAYFPINNCYPLLLSLDFEPRRPIGACPYCRHDRVDHIDHPSLYAHIPTHLQTVRRLTALDEQRLVRYRQELQARRSFFLSYRRRDTSALTRVFADELGRHGALYWLDQEMIRYEAAAPEQELPPQALLQMLSDAVRQADGFVAFVSPGYWDSAWIKHELACADRFAQSAHLRHRIAIGLGGRPDRLSGGWQWYDLGQSPDRHEAARELARDLLGGAA